MRVDLTKLEKITATERLNMRRYKVRQLLAMKYPIETIAQMLGVGKETVLKDISKIRLQKLNAAIEDTKVLYSDYIQNIENRRDVLWKNLKDEDISKKDIVAITKELREEDMFNLKVHQLYGSVPSDKPIISVTEENKIMNVTFQVPEELKEATIINPLPQATEEFNITKFKKPVQNDYV